MASASRIGRAAGAAALSTLAALTMHVVAGGGTPAAAGILVPLAVAFTVGVQLAGRPLGRLRLALLLSASQLAFHAAFAFGTSDAPTIHTHHAGATLGPLEASAHAAMPAAHVGAALVSYAVIRRADSLLTALARLVDLVANDLVAGLRLAHRVTIRPAAPPRTLATAPALYSAVSVRSRVTRGPPGIA